MLSISWARLPVLLAALLLRVKIPLLSRGSTTTRPQLTNTDLLLVVSPGDVKSSDAANQLGEACAAMAKRGVRRLLLREPHLSKRQVERLIRDLKDLYPPGGLLLHEKCVG